MIIFLQSFAFAQQKNEALARNSFQSYLNHFSLQDSGTFFFHSERENNLLDISSKTTNFFSFVKQKPVDTPFLFIENSINNLGDTDTYFQDGNFFYVAKNTGKSHKNIHALKKQPKSWVNILALMNTHLFTGLITDKDEYIKKYQILTFYSVVAETDTSIKGIQCKQFKVTYSVPDTNLRKSIRKFCFRTYDSLLMYFYGKDIYLNDSSYSEYILDSISLNVSTKNLLKEIEKKKKHFLRTCKLDIVRTNGIPKQKPLEIAGTMPDFEGVDVNGKIITIQNFKDKYIILDFWYAGCGPCAYSIQSLEELYSRYKNKGLEVLSLNAADDLDAIKRYIDKHSITYTSLHIDKKVEQVFGFEDYPSFFLFDPNHKLVFATSGYGPNLYERLSSAFEELIHK